MGLTVADSKAANSAKGINSLATELVAVFAEEFF